MDGETPTRSCAELCGPFQRTNPRRRPFSRFGAQLEDGRAARRGGWGTHGGRTDARLLPAPTSRAGGWAKGCAGSVPVAYGPPATDDVALLLRYPAKMASQKAAMGDLRAVQLRLLLCVDVRDPCKSLMASQETDRKRGIAVQGCAARAAQENKKIAVCAKQIIRRSREIIFALSVVQYMK